MIECQLLPGFSTTKTFMSKAIEDCAPLRSCYSSSSIFEHSPSVSLVLLSKSWVIGVVKNLIFLFMIFCAAIFIPASLPLLFDIARVPFAIGVWILFLFPLSIHPHFVGVRGPVFSGPLIYQIPMAVFVFCIFFAHLLMIFFHPLRSVASVSFYVFTTPLFRKVAGALFAYGCASIFPEARPIKIFNIFFYSAFCTNSFFHTFILPQIATLAELVK